MPSLLKVLSRFKRIFISRKTKNRKSKDNSPTDCEDQLLTQQEDVEKTVEMTPPPTKNPINPSPSVQPPVEHKTSRKPVPTIKYRQATVDDYQNGIPIPEASSFHSLQLSPDISRSNSASSQLSRSDSRSSSASGHWLRDQLHEARIECPHRAHCFFVPRCDQERLINVDSVSKDIRSHDSEVEDSEATKHAEKACESARQLYATLAYIKKGADICSLLEEGITDRDLPFVRTPNTRRKFALYRKNGEPIKALEGWKDKSLEKFDRFQWWMIAPVFRPSEEPYELDAKTLLPFVPLDTAKKGLDHKQGGYSEVYPARIHPAHHEFWDVSGAVEEGPLVAVKKLFSSDYNEFMKEATILNKIGLKPHPHLIKLLATYKHEGKYHLIFPYANANLRKYWDERPSPAFDKATVLWSLKQMAGIANGLLRVHTFSVTIPLKATPGAGNVRLAKDVQLMVKEGEEWYGRHGDIKPENVLWFQKDRLNQDPNGVLQIADFGLGRFHGRDSRSRVDPESVQTSPTYEPPECQLRHPVSRAYDIWSLGCLYLEFVTWLLMGSENIEGFSNFRGREATGTGINDDNFFTIINDSAGRRAIVRTSVVEWKDRLHAHERCSELIHDLLELIMKGLLVTETNNRYKANWVFHHLDQCLQKALMDDDYMLKPVPHPAKPANERSVSTPTVMGVPSTRSKRKSVDFAEGTKQPPVRTTSPLQLPIDLVQRIAGTPSIRIPTHPTLTWPAGVNKQQMAR